MAESATIVRYLSYEEAARYSGLSETTLRRLIRAGKLRAARPVARRILIDRLALDEYMRSAGSEGNSRQEAS